MKIDTNDPRITAFALGELTGSEATEIARAVRTDSRIRAAVDDVRETASLLHDTLGGGNVQLLTADQRAAVRRAGEGPAITHIASARVPFWKRPAVVGAGVAAAVALGIFLTSRPHNPGQPIITVADDPRWDWSRVGMENLTAPAPADSQGGTTPGTSVHAVAAAISEDTPSFRRELRKRIDEQDLKAPAKLPELERHGWKEVSGRDSATLSVPLASGAMSWPLLKRYIREQGTLPPRKAIRIEEMVNHFDYTPPTMLKGGGLVADMELCRTPWNPATVLVAVHVSAGTPAVDHPHATLTLNADRVRRVRLLGYAGIKTTGSEPAPAAGPCHISRSRGNYVLYEIEPAPDVAAADDAGSTPPLVTLALTAGAADTLAAGNRPVGSWLTASSDLRFASTVAAAGMLLSSAKAPGELDPARLQSLLQVLKTKAPDSIPAERKAALELLDEAAKMLQKPASPQG